MSSCRPPSGGNRMRPARFARCSAVLVLSLATAYAQPRPAADLRIVAMDHLESKGVTAWIAASASGERALWIARLGSDLKVRSRDPRLRDVTLDPSGRGAFLLVGDEAASGISYAVLDSDDAPRLLAPRLGRTEASMHRAGDGAIVVGEDEVMVVPRVGEPQTLLHRDDPAVTSVARNE